MLKVSKLQCRRNQRILFSGLTFAVKPGELGLVSGINGAGKSTLLKILAGLWHSFSGNISWQEQSIKPGDPFFFSELLYSGHKMGIQPYLTPTENLKWLVGIQRRLKITEDNIQTALSAVGLAGLEHIPCEYLSKGQQHRVGLARLWIMPPSCWILDEPFTALDAPGRDLLQNRFESHLNAGGCLLIASHQPVEVKKFTVIEISLGNK